MAAGTVVYCWIVDIWLNAVGPRTVRNVPMSSDGSRPLCKSYKLSSTTSSYRELLYRDVNLKIVISNKTGSVNIH